MTAIRVLVVDDSALVRRLVTTALAQASDIEVAGVARDGLEAVRMVDEIAPDVVTLDIEMPHLDGLGALAQIREKHARLPVIMFSTLTERGARTTLEALSLGASDYVTKPSNTGQIADGIAAIRDQLVPRIRALAGIRRLTPGPSRPVVRRERPSPATQAVDAVLIGCSTGGPDALARLLPRLPGDLGVPVLVVQHMPPVFTTMLAQRLDKLCALTVREAVDGEEVRAGDVLIAPGDFHLRLRRSADSVRVALDQGAQENFCRPAVDVLFRSALDVYGGSVLATVLTGMGHDGLAGVRQLGGAGARILVQDEESSVVWGMPGAVATAGLADDVLPLHVLGDRMTSIVRRARAVTAT